MQGQVTGAPRRARQWFGTTLCSVVILVILVVFFFTFSTVQVGSGDFANVVP